MSKILLSFSTLNAGGAAQVCAHLSYPLCDAYDDVILITWTDEPQFFNYDKRAKWFCVEKEVGGTNELKRMLWFRKLVKRERPDLLLSFLEPWNLRVLMCTMGLGVKTIVAERSEPHGVNKYWIMDQIEKAVYHLSSGILVQTETIKHFFNGSLSDRTTIIYNPVNINSEEVGLALQTLKKNRIVCAARLVVAKNLDVLISAFSIFLRNHPDYELTIYGEGPLKDKLIKQSSDLGISNSVFFPGPSKTIHQEILDAQMMCLVSNREGMSNSMIESLCLGLPCICTKVSGAVDLIKDGENGFLVDIGDVEGLSAAMSKVADDKKLAYKVGENATKLYEILNKEKIYAEWMSYLKNQNNFKA